MKKILSVLLSLLLLCSCIPLGAVTAATAGTVYGTVDQSDVAPGDTFTMSVQMENNPGLVCWLIDVDFDSAALELVSQTKGDAFSGIGTFSFGPIKEGYTNALWYDFLAMDDYTNNGYLFSLTFRVKEGASAGNYPITLYCSDWDNMCNAAFDRADFDFVSPTVTVTAGEEPACQHEYYYPCDQYCMLCWELTNPDASHDVIAVESKAATCVEMGNIAYWYCDICGAAWLDAECTINTNLMAVRLPMTDHVYDDDYDADCNVCGMTRDVPDVPVVGSEATLSFHDKANRVSYSTEQQVWSQNGITVTNDKAASTSSVGDYGGDGYPARFYKNTALTIEYTGMTKIVFNCDDYKATYATDLAASITTGTVTVDGTAVTVIFDAPVDSLYIEALVAQVRVDSIVVTSGEGTDTPADPSFDGYVTNGDFETGDATAWETWLPSEICSDAAYEGTYGAHLIGDGGWGSLLSQTIPVEAGESYELSFWVKVNNMGANLQIYDGTWDGTLLVGAWLSAYDYGSWTQMAYTVTPTTDSLFLNFCGAGAGVVEDVYVDAVTVKKLAQASSDGYITNGDFETGQIAPWDNLWGSNTVAMVDGHNGGWAMQVQSGEWKHVRQLVAVKPYTDYTITYWAKDVYCASLLIKDSSDSYNIADAYMSGNTEWTQNTVTFNSGNHTAVYVSFMGTDYTAYYTVDDVVMTEVATAPTIYGVVDKDTLNVGDTFTLDVYMEGNPGLSGWLVDLDYDSTALELIQQTAGTAFTTGSLSFGPMNGGSTNALWYDFLNPDVAFNGHLFSLTFRVKADAPAGAYLLDLYCSDADNMINGDYESISFDFSDVYVTVMAHTHIYDHACDAYCNECGAYRVTTHTYDNACDAYCNECGAYRSTAHTYTSACDAYCNVCSAYRTAPHAYDNACDAYCNLCSTYRTPAAHVYSSAADTSCNVCGAIRVVSGATIYGVVSDTAVERGDTFTLDVCIRDNPGLVGWNVTVEYNETALELVQREAGDAFPTSGMSYGPLKSPFSTTFMDALNPDVVGDGVMVSLTFRVKDTATLGDYTFTIGTRNGDMENFYNQNWDTIPVQFEDASVSVFAHTHTYVSAVTKAPTCGATGLMTYTCSTCGDYYTESIPATGEHVFDAAFDCIQCGYSLSVIYGTVDADAVAPGDTFTLAVHMANNPGLVGWLLDVDFDSTALELVSQTEGEAFDGIGSISFGPIKDGYTNVLWYDFLSTENYINNGCMFYLTFRVKEGAPAGFSNIHLYCSDPDNICNVDYVTPAFDFRDVGVTLLDHRHVYDNACDATCNICYELREVEPHAYGSEVTLAPTCVAMGIKTYTCSICGDSYTESIPATGVHTYKAVVTAPDCINGGYTTYTCTVCGDMYRANHTDALGHSYWSEVTLAPTCVVDGVMTYTCSVCGDTYTEVIPATGEHIYKEIVTAPDCINGGYTTYTCTVCGHTYVADHTAALGHDYESEITLAATCGTDGVMTYTCSVCDDTYTEVIPATGKHTYASEITLAPTCAVEGVRTYTCSVCGDSYTESIPATGEHTYDNACDATCNVCGGVREVPGHSFVGSFTCSVCGYALDVNSDPIIHGTVDVTDAAPGETFTLTVNMANNPGLSGWLVGIDYDIQSLELIEQTAGDIFNPVTFGPMDTLPTRASWYDFLSGDTTASGILFSLTFRVKEGVATGDTVIKLYSTDPDNFTTVDEQTVYFDFVDAVVSLLDHRHVYESAVTTAPTCVAEGVLTYTCSICGDSYTESIPATGVHTYDDDDDATCNDCDYVRDLTDPGDVNKDGKVNIRDVGLMQQWMNGWNVEFYEKAADVNNDGKINIRDVGLMQQWLNGWNVELI